MAYETLATVNINGRFQPMHRAELEDVVKMLLEKAGIGTLGEGGGTLQLPSGEVKECDFDVLLRDDAADTIKTLANILNRVGVPKGSEIIVDGDEEKRVPVGTFEGLALYLNGTDLPDEVYSNNDVNDLIELLDGALGEAGYLLSWWEGPRESALYFYGESFEKMRSLVLPVTAEQPLCARCRIEQIA